MSQECHSLLLPQEGRWAAQVATLSCDFRSGHVIPEHFHPEDQLVFASRGVMTVRTKQGIWVVPPLRAVWIPARTPHSITVSGAVSMRTMYFLPKLITVGRGECLVLNVSPLLRELILHACDFPRLKKAVPAQGRIIAMIADQLAAARSITLQLPHPSDPRAMRVVQALLADPGGRVTLDDLCKHCGATKRTIQRTFLAETHLTFGRWRQQLRLLHALQRLAAGAKVTGAALDAGYNSTSAFIAMFRKQLGTTPTRYFES